MSNIVKLIKHEEGWRSRPYICKLGYPTVGYGFRIGPKYADLKFYDFQLPQSVGDIWLIDHIEKTRQEMLKHIEISAAMSGCAGNEARISVLISMAFQMGVPGLLKFKNALSAIANQNWPQARKEMLNSLWASESQTPARALRHAIQMQDGVWFSGY